MNLDHDRAASRPLGVASKLLDRAVDAAAISLKEVVLTGERDILSSENGRWCFLDALTLLSRVVGKLTVVMPLGMDALRAEVEMYSSRLWSQTPIQVTSVGNPITLESSDAVLSVGAQVKPSLNWTVINSNGWVARVSSGVTSLPCDVDQPNPLGALMAASFGVTEVFKRIFSVPHEVAPLFEKTEFSLFDQTTTSASVGPPLPDSLNIPDTLLVGAGAIGNGIALLLSRLNLRGRVHLVDKQDYADENLGTCILLERAGWIGVGKAVRLANWLGENSNLEVTAEKSVIASALDGPLLSRLTVDLVLNGLDDAEARRDAQGLWPAIIVDGGINEIGTAVVQHRLDQERRACLKCWFESPQVDERLQQSRLTGLNIASLNDLGRTLTDDDIAHAAEDKRDWLLERKTEGKTLCSVISEAALSTKLGVEVEEGFRPSVPFVATAAASMVMAEAVKALAFPEVPVAGMFQIASLFLGPGETAMKLDRLPSVSCPCVVHRATILRLHASRQRMHPQPSPLQDEPV